MARRVGALTALEDGREEERAESARAAYSDPPKTWVLTCHYRGCGRPFEVPRGWHRKPDYCIEEHGRLEKKARQLDRAAAAAGV
ncbi:MAG TPA: hypothetical protein VIU16_01935 [Gaiellaceae bacterium]